MTNQTPTQFTVECTECEFSKTIVRTDDGWTVDRVAAHLETGHTLRTVAVDEQADGRP